MVTRDEKGKWLPGTTGNPLGRPKTHQDILDAKRLNRNELERTLARFLTMTPEELKAIKENPNSTITELLLYSIITNAINKGDHQRFSFLLDRAVGPVTEDINIRMRPYEDMPDEELERKIIELRNSQGSA